MMTNSETRRHLQAAGFSLIELMVALLLGILLSLGLVTLFDATSKTNRVQEMLAELQENGRYAMTRINGDLRLASRQMMSMSGYIYATPGTNGMVNSTLAANVYVDGSSTGPGVPFPDGTVRAPTGWIAALPGYTRWPLSPAYFMQAYVCGTSTCTPNSVPSYVPAIGTGAGSRVQNSDVLTVRYLNATGWSSYNGEVAIASCAAGGNAVTGITLTPTTGTGTTFAAGDLALLTSSSGDASIFAVTAALVPNGVPNGGSVPCAGGGEVKLFNFSADFITVTYWLQLAADPNVPGRLIPVLMRAQGNNRAVVAGTNPLPAELVQGVEQMNFLYGVQFADGSMQYLSADNVVAKSTSTNCVLPPEQYVETIPGTFETGTDGVTTICLWRSVKGVEAHVLMDSVNNLFSLSPPELNYQYNGSGWVAPPAPAAAMTSTGIAAGSMMRREFVSLASVRNFNP